MNLDKFIRYQAKKIARVYGSSNADENDYIQIGHLKLAELNESKHDECNFGAYAIIVISRAMRQEALDTMYSISAPYRIKLAIHRVEMLFLDGKTEKEICEKLKITPKKLIDLWSLIRTKSWDDSFTQPKCYPDPFSVFDDLLSSDRLRDEDRDFILNHFINDETDSFLSGKQKWTKSKDIRPKLARSGYGI